MGVLEKAGDKKKAIVVEEDSDNESAQAELVKLKQIEIDREPALRVQLEEQFKVKQIQLDKDVAGGMIEGAIREAQAGEGENEKTKKTQEGMADKSGTSQRVENDSEETDKDMTEEKKKKSLRLMEKEDKKVADAAAERKEDLNAFINKG
ncbi:hypothetical protein OsI_10022 [Oryza sativa Indica Group]|uniref:Uncharacterized protein n=1 Tax=Oryza sativa subsp. indica TaxID=39946 RepID=B8ANB6_ORYSI|nr:hypothetical protein OsI_10022 [Oryza sativa Indica Group]